MTEGRYSWSDDIFVYGDDDCVGSEGRVLEDDIVEFYGTAEGTWSYETIFGATREVPLIFCIDDSNSRDIQRLMWDIFQRFIQDEKSGGK